MIGYFPVPYPDELLYSIIARYSDRLRLPTKSAVTQSLFGERYACAIVDLPHRLDTLVSVLPPGHPLTSEDLIEGHTLLPYYGPFLKPETYVTIREMLRGSVDSGTRVRCGIVRSRVRPPRFFRYCPDCIADDRTRYGETYWRRLFQITGVEVCPRHHTFLERSALRLEPLGDRHRYCSAETNIAPSVGTALNSADRSHQLLVVLAENVSWLLEHPGLNPGFEALRNGLLGRLKGRGLITTKGGSIRMAELAREIRSFYPPDFLELLQSAFQDDGGYGWLGKLLHCRESGAAPLRWLLLMVFLEMKPEDLLAPSGDSSRTATAEFRGPWACLNPVCTEHGKGVVPGFNLDRVSKRHADVAVMQCRVCGYTYALYDWTKIAGRPDFVRDYGPIWKDRLKSMWCDSSISVRRMAQVLGADSKTVKSYSRELGLEFPRNGKRTAGDQDLYRRRPLPPKYTVKFQRRQWIELLRANPNLNCSGLRRLDTALYSWLYHADRPWLRKNQPTAPARAKRPGVDWSSRDEELAPLIATAAAHIKHAAGKSRQVTRTAIGRKLGRQALFEKRLHHLPLTRLILQSVVESSEEFAARRIAMAAAHLRKRQGSFERWELVRAAGLRKAVEEWPAVEAALAYELRPVVRAEHHESVRAG